MPVAPDGVGDKAGAAGLCGTRPAELRACFG